VRRMAAGETMELLSGKVIDGSAAPLVIADGKRPVALAGIMGGRATETNEDTVDVLLEAAYFDPVNIRSTVRKVDIGLESRGTDSSYRFERGTDPNTMLEGGLKRASSLIVELAGGRLVGPAVDHYPAKRKPRAFRLTPERVSSYLGTEIDAATIRDSLQRLQMECSEDLNVAVPTWRADANDPVVLIEDVARMVGYDRVPMKPSCAIPTVGRRCTKDRLREAIAQHLVAVGYLECRNLPLESPEKSEKLIPAAAGSRVSVTNPLSSEMSVLRNSLLTGLLASVDRNVRRGANWVRLFEIDRAFALTPPDSVPGEKWQVAAIAAGPLQEFDWRNNSAAFDFPTVKGIVESLLQALRVKDYCFKPASAAPYVPGAVAAITAGSATLGYVGELPRDLIERSPFRLFAFELDVEALEPSFLEIPRAKALARTPAVTRDLAIVISEEKVFAEIEADIRATAGDLLESLRLVDVYQGPQVPAGHKSLALHLIFRNPQGSLTAEEVSGVIEKILTSLQNHFAAQLRA
jgi:phenylalanyl-tRNA synthetase beta chain